MPSCSPGHARETSSAIVPCLCSMREKQQPAGPFSSRLYPYTTGTGIAVLCLYNTGQIEGSIPGAGAKVFACFEKKNLDATVQIVNSSKLSLFSFLLYTAPCPLFVRASQRAPRYSRDIEHSLFSLSPRTICLSSHIHHSFIRKTSSSHRSFSSRSVMWPSTQTVSDRVRKIHPSSAYQYTPAELASLCKIHSPTRKIMFTSINQNISLVAFFYLLPSPGWPDTCLTRCARPALSLIMECELLKAASRCEITILVHPANALSITLITRASISSSRLDVASSIRTIFVRIVS